MNIEVGALCTIAGAVVGYLGYKKKSEKDIEDDAAQKTLVATDIKYIKDIVIDIKNDFRDLRLELKDHDNKINTVIERLIKVEESTKSAHHRIDELIKKGDVSNEK